MQIETWLGGRRIVGLGLALLATVAATPSCGARTGLPVPDPCANVDLELPRKIADLDMHIMLDSSGSMVDPVVGTTTKWQATTTALQSFLQAPDAAGLGVGMTFFPVVDANVPATCSPDPNACGAPDACTQIGICIDSETICEMDIGCVAPGFPDEPCVELGFCELAPDQACSLELGVPCATGTGACIDYTFCENHYTCDVGAYASPVVSVLALPEGGGDLIAAMQARIPEGSTTTLPALQGAHGQAALGESARPERRQAVVLATDGLPTACDAALDGTSDDLAIEHLADVAEAAAATGVRTFVVGVFSEVEAEAAQQNLDAIAKAGGTEAAFIVGADGNLSDDFARALEQARVAASSCEYPLPEGSEGVDLERAQLKLSAPGLDDTLELLGTASECTVGVSGVYLVQGQDARRLVLCPSICEAVGDTVDASIHLTHVCAGS